MKLFKSTAFRILILISVFINTLNAQKNVSGKIFDGRTNEPLIGASVVIKGTTIGGVTDPEGAFDFNPQQKPPFTLAISFVGYTSQELSITSDTKMPLSLKLSDASEVKDAVEVIGQRVSEKTKQSQLTVESMDKIAIKQQTGITFYEGLSNLKGVDATTASLGFTVINTRGFNSTSPVRSLQIIDGVDNQAPGLNFSLGNFLGASELDVLKVDLVVGASSAYFGPNAFNGVISMSTKSPFYNKGLSAQVKTGERSLVETAFRWADALKNKNGKDWFGYKFNFYRIQAYDWVADNYDPVFKTNVPKTNSGGYDAVNRYGDEYSSSLDFTGSQKSQPWVYPGLGEVHRRGYNEVDLVDYHVNNIKINAAAHFRLKPDMEDKSPELIVSSNFGNGNTVYQGDNRFALKDILFFQQRVELRQNDKFFVRAYATNEDAGNSYDPYFTALLMQSQSKSIDKWQPDYLFYWQRQIIPKERELGYPNLTTVTNPDGTISAKFDQAAADKFLITYQDSLVKWSNDAKTYADTFRTSNPYFVPGTQRFNDQFNALTSKKSSKRDLQSGGTGLYDKSALYHIQGEYHFTPGFVNDWTVGGNYRLYAPNSQGTIFYDTAGNKITNTEFGIYTGIEKKFLDNKLKVNATLRMDKNQNFDYLFSPAASLVYQPNNKDFFRFSFSSAIRNPTLNDQYLYLNVGPAILAGNTTGQTNLVTVSSFTDFINAYFQKDRLKYFNIDPIRPEKVKSGEIGYRTTLFNNTYIDASYYYSWYTDFIGYQIGIRTDFSATGLPENVQAYRYAANAKSTVTTQGFSIGISHYFAKYYQLSGNYTWNKLNTASKDSIIPAYNTPENKFNVGISGRDMTIGKLQHFGFNFNYKWIQGFLYEGSPQFTGQVPTYDLLDGQVNFGFPKINTTLKIGASNILNKLQFQTYGGPRIGRMAYISLLYDFVKK